MAGRFFLIFIAITLIEIYFLQAVKTFVQDFSPSKKNFILYTAYILAILNFFLSIAAIISPPSGWNSFLRIVTISSFILVVCKLFGISFLLIDDVVRLFRWVATLFTNKTAETTEAVLKISRFKFLSQLAVTFTVIPAIGFIYGVVKGAYRFKVHHVKIPSPNLPEAFNGFKIIQISDIHTGSFTDTSALDKAFDIIMAQGADMILFTGDLVNNTTAETKGFEEVFKKLKAPFGVYSVLGNHDYGDYAQWSSQTEKHKNFEYMKAVHRNAGWRLLMNEHVALEKDGAQIALLGVENWGGNLHFKKYGKLDQAHSGTEHYPFRILMSHDPSHWEQQVRKEYQNVDLTLSGHTHGMQLGIEIPGFRWSPVKYLYKHWAGLYSDGQQYLYVNRGLGFLGYPGRLGIWPEISVLELQKA
jgi:uncharacterized protein